MARDWKYALALGVALILGGLAIVATVAPLANPIQWLLAAGWTLIALGVLACTPALWRLIRPTRQWLWRVVGRTRKPSFAYFNLPSDIGCIDAGSPIIAAFSTAGRSDHKVKIADPSHYGLPDNPPKPSRIVLLHPKGAGTLSELDLPATIHSRRDNLRITHFIEGGFVIDEGRSVGDSVNIETYFDWRTNPTASTSGDSGAYDRWRESLELRRRGTPTPVVGAGMGLAAKAAEAWSQNEERLTRARASKPPTSEELAPYSELRALRQLHRDGEILRIAHEDAGAWRQRVEGVLREPYLKQFREIDGHTVAVGYVDYVVSRLEAEISLADRVALLRRLVRVGKSLKLKTPSRGDWMDHPVFIETGSWVRNIEDVLPLEWQQAWEEKPYKSSSHIAGIQPDFDRALSWLEETIETLDAQVLLSQT